MTAHAEKTLLPAGLEDALPPRAELEATVIERLIASFGKHGYRRVKPPLIEFEESLLSGPGRTLAEQTFRLMDPQSHRMLGVRPDITVQIARIASSRLRSEPRPLRLSYAGEVLRVRGGQLRPERQFAQAGFELIGATGVTADAEVLVVAAEALAGVAVEHLSVDITMPMLVPQLCRDLGLPQDVNATVRTALDRKDAGALVTLGEGHRRLFQGLLAAAGPADEALATLRRLALPVGARPMVEELAALLAAVRQALPDLVLTVDPGESRGFEYHTGVSFTVFARGVRGELGRGGRYELESGESATGFTVYLDSLMRAVTPPPSAPRLFLPFGTSAAEARRWRQEGWQTVAALQSSPDAAAEARRLGCTHIVSLGKAQALA